MLINFVKQDTRDSQQYLTNANSDDTSLERDTLGNFACATIFVKNFAPELTQEKLTHLFPTAVKIVPGNKQLRPGEFRTAYVTFEDTAAAISARRVMTGYTDEEQSMPLVIYYSVRPQDQNKSSAYGVVGFQKALGPGGGYGGGHQSIYPSVPSPVHPSAYPPSPYGPALAALHPYSGLPGIYGGAPPGYPDPYAHVASVNPYHQRMGAASPVDDARYSLSDLFDSKGNAASNGLFVDCLPYDIRENQIHAIFAHTHGFKGLHMGNKALSPNEYRTAIIHFTSTENALRARAKLQYYREPGWSRPLIIHYAKH